MLLPDLALLLKLTEIVLVTLNGMLVLTNAWNVMSVKLVIM
jgi:hypothetical protein